MKATDFSTNIAQTTPDDASENLRTRFSPNTLEDMAQNIQTLVPTLRTYGQHWKVTGTRRQDATTTIDCTVPVLFFTDDLTVSLSAENGQTRIDVRSQSRVGRGDLGENRRHIAQLLQKLDQTQRETP